MSLSRAVVAGVVCALAGFGLTGLARADTPVGGGAAGAGVAVAVPDAPVAGAQSRWRDRGTHSAGTSAATHAKLRDAHVVPLGASPQLFVVDARTRTAYVSSDDGIVSVVDIGHCNARVSDACGAPIAEIAGPDFAIGVAEYSSTLYVSSGFDGDGAVSVYDLTHCRAGDVSGCGPAFATIPIADIPIGVEADPATGTVYVGNLAPRVDVIDARSCRAGRSSGCAGALVGSIPATDGPLFPAVDSARQTLYLPANGPYGDMTGDVVHVVDLRQCRGGDTSGCAAAQPSLPAAAGAVVAHLDAATGTLYVANQGAATVSVLDVRHCSGADATGCAQTPAQVPVGANASGGIAETRDGRLFVANSSSDTLSTFDTAHCRSGDTTGCPTAPVPTVRSGGSPFWITYDAATNSLFTVANANRTFGVLDANVCAANGRGCRVLLPSIGGNQPPQGGNLQLFADSAVHTWYGVDAAGNLTLTDTRICNVQHPERCEAAAFHTSVPNISYGRMVADDSTHSLYMIRVNLNTFRGSVVVLDTRTCNAEVHTRCSPVAAPTRLPNYPAVLAIDTSTHTVYVSTQEDSSLQVIDGQRCNALLQTACAAPVGAVPLAGAVYGVAVDTASRTVYVTEFGNDFDSDVVYAVDDTHCRAGDVSGCASTPKRFTSGRAPLGVVADTAHHTLYVLAAEGGDNGGQVDVFDTTTCNARVARGCDPVVAVDVARNPFLGTLDPATQRLFVSGFEHAAISVLDTARCNATNTRGCVDQQLEVGDYPRRISIDPDTHSAFIQSALYDRTYYVDTRLR